MILFTDGLYTFLTTNAALLALIGNSSTRSDKMSGIFPTMATGAPTLPFITYTQISSTSLESFEGANRLQWNRFRFTSYALSYAQAKKLGNTLKMALNSYQGTWVNGVVILDASIQMEADDTESVPKGTIFACHTDIQFTWLDPDPSLPFTPTGPVSTIVDGGTF